MIQHLGHRIYTLTWQKNGFSLTALFLLEKMQWCWWRQLPFLHNTVSFSHNNDNSDSNDKSIIYCKLICVWSTVSSDLYIITCNLHKKCKLDIISPIIQRKILKYEYHTATKGWSPGSLISKTEFLTTMLKEINCKNSKGRNKLISR